MNRRETKIIKLRPPQHAGMLIFILLLIYVVVMICFYFARNPISVYQVTQGQIEVDQVYTGLILRDETVVYADSSGYLTYYKADGARVAVNDIIYSIDRDAGSSSEIQSSSISENGLLSADRLAEYDDLVYETFSQYDSMNYAAMAAKQLSLSSEIGSQLNSQALESLSALNNSASLQKTDCPGVISYSVDGYEKLQPDSFSADQFSPDDYQSYDLYSRSEIEQADPVYKIVNSETWYIYLPIDGETAETLEQKSSVSIIFLSDSYSTTADCSILKQEGEYYLKLTLKDGMVRYISQRYVQVELCMQQATGLKIPVSSIVSKNAYAIPKGYFINNTQLVRIDSDGTKETLSPEILAKTQTDYYVDASLFSEGDTIISGNSLQTYTITDLPGNDTSGTAADLSGDSAAGLSGNSAAGLSGDSAAGLSGEDTSDDNDEEPLDTINGVYIVNKGYAEFCMVSIKASNDSYAIIDNDSSCDLALYDRIALDGSKVTDGQIVNTR